MLSLEEEVEGVQEDLEEPTPEDRGCGGPGRGVSVPGPQGTIVSAWGPTGHCCSKERLDPSESDNPVLSLLMARSSRVSHPTCQSLRFLACKMGTERSNYRPASKTE